MNPDSDSRPTMASPVDQGGLVGMTGRRDRENGSQPLVMDGYVIPHYVIDQAIGLRPLLAQIDEYRSRQRRSAMRTAYRAKTKHRRRNR